MAICDQQKPPPTHWNTHSIRAFASSRALPMWKANIEAAIAELGDRPALEHLDESVMQLLALDNELDRAWSALNLNHIQPLGLETLSALPAWLSDVSQQLLDQMDLTCQAALNSPGNASNETLQWAQAFQSESSFESLSRHYQPRKSHADSSVDMRPALCSRSKIDPDAWAFQYRLQQNDLRPKDVDFQATHQAQSQLYFQQLVECMGVRSAPLSDVRAFEARQWETVEFTWSQAIECVGHCFHEVDASFRQRLSDLLSQGQVRVTQDAYQPDLCLDTAFGSFVQLHFDGSLGSVVRLAHELGHAIHQSMYRDHPSQQTSPAPLEQEIWAMTFERCLLQTLCADFPDWIRQLNAFRQSQWIEMNHRHRMLTAFEQALHRPEVQCDTAVNQLWLEYNQGFYGSRITLDPSFRTAWQDIHHFWQAPFYLAIYPNAIERAAQSDLRQMIHPYRQ